MAQDQQKREVVHVTILEYTENAAEHGRTPGKRVIVGGHRRNTHVRDDDKEGFVEIAEAVAVIELHKPICEDEITDWCNSQAGKLALSEWVGNKEPAEIIDTGTAAKKRAMTDGGRSETEIAQCGYCDTEELAYELRSDRGPVVRCIECLAIEQIQQQLSLPFDVWIDRDMVEPPDQEEFPEAPDFEAFDPTEHDYKTARAWATILARLKDDDPILKRDPETHGTVFEGTREFVTNIMGSDAHKRPSELRGGGSA